MIKIMDSSTLTQTLNLNNELTFKHNQQPFDSTPLKKAAWLTMTPMTHPYPPFQHLRLTYFDPSKAKGLSWDGASWPGAAKRAWGARTTKVRKDEKPTKNTRVIMNDTMNEEPNTPHNF